MNEQCADCPWFDNHNEVCCRKPPRLCDVDEALASPRPPTVDAETDTAEADLPVKPTPAGYL